MLRRYAAHYLRWGGQIALYPLLTLNEEGELLLLEPFTEEREGIVFLDGVIDLSISRDEQQPCELADCERVPLYELVAILEHRYKEIEVLLPL